MSNKINTKIEYHQINGDTYVLVHEAASKKHQSFQNAVMDEQFIIYPKRDNEQEFDEDYNYYINGVDDTYADTVVYFIPQKDVVAAKEQVEKMLNEWKNEGEHILHFDEGVIYIAYKYTPSGMWVFISDNTGDDNFYSDAFEIFDDIFNVVCLADTNTICNNTTLYVTGGPAESSGADFCNGLLREKDPIVALMVAEGLMFDDVEEPEID